MYLGCGYAWVGILDLLHALSLENMTIYDVSNANIASQIWIVTRYLEALILFTAPYIMSKYFNRAMVFTLYGLLSSVLIFLVFTKLFPNTYIEGEGLTPFKIYSEYLIILILIFASVNLWIRKKEFEQKIFISIL